MEIVGNYYLFPDAKLPENIPQYFIITNLSRNFSKIMHTFPDILALIDFFEEVPEYDSAMYCHKKMKTNEETSSFREYREEKNMWLYRAYCRIFQAVLKAGNYFMGYRMPDYIEGPGCIKRMPELLKKDNVNNILLVTGPNITKRGLNRGLMEALDEAGISYTVFNHIGANPTSDMVEEGVKLYHEKNCQAIIAFGGGSPMDCAKGIGARIARPNKSIAQLQGLLKVFKKIPVFYAVPTTAGSGSETTVAAVITDTATHHKAAIMDTHLIPRCAVLDPSLP